MAPPSGPWVMVQRWHDLLFAHWRCSVSEPQPLIPAPLQVDTYEGHAWIGVIPFYMSNVRMRGAPPAPPGTLDPFLTERYCLYASHGKRIWRADIVHPAWRLQGADATIEHNSLIAAAGIRVPEHAPLLHFSAFQDVRFWWPVRVR